MKWVCCIALFALSLVTFSQKNTAFLELGGMGGFVSANYERQLFDTPQLHFRIGLGMTFFGYIEDTPDETVPGCVLCGINLGGPETVALTLPVSLHYLVAMGNTNFLETGVGASWQESEGSKYPLYASVGFRRYFGKADDWMWNVRFTPLLGVGGKNEVRDNEPILWGGFSIGKRF